jgi:ferrous iron transport protein A
MPLSQIEIGKRCRIKGVTGDDAVRHRLGALGFVEGMEVEIVAEVGGNFVVGVLGSRVAVDGALAKRILV